MKVCGASAGSLTSALLLTNVDFDHAADCAIRLAHEFGVYERKNPFVFWGPILRNWLEEILPDEDVHYHLPHLEIAITPASPFKPPELISGFHCKEELIEACMASCHVPLFLDGKAFTHYRGEAYLDGSFWYFVTKDRFTGLPLPPNLPSKDIFWVDYCDDEEFMAKISGNILETITPVTMREMMQDGYNFMQRKHAMGRIPEQLFLPNSQTTIEGILFSGEEEQKMNEEVEEELMLKQGGGLVGGKAFLFQYISDSLKKIPLKLPSRGRASSIATL